MLATALEIVVSSHNAGASDGSAKVTQLQARNIELLAAKKDAEVRIAELEAEVYKLTSQLGDLTLQCERSELTRAKQEKELELHAKSRQATELKLREAICRDEKAEDEVKKESIKLSNCEKLVAGKVAEMKVKSDEKEKLSASLSKS